MANFINDMVAMFQQSANQQTADMEQHLIGHVIEYDAASHMCRVMLPTRGGEDEDGKTEVMETGWIQVGSPVVGNGWGLQFALHGGATGDNPELGEQVQISIQHRHSGLCAVANLTYNDTMEPPGRGDNQNQNQNQDPDEDHDGDQQLVAGEIIMKHESGSFVKFYEDGSVRLVVQQKLFVEVLEGDVDIRVEEGDVEVEIAEGDVNVAIDEGDLEVTIGEGDCTVLIGEGDADLTLGEGDLNVEILEGDLHAAVTMGDTIVESLDGSIVAYTGAGDVLVQADAGFVDVVAGLEASITAPIVNIFSPLINLGTLTLQSLCNAYHAMVTYNNHTHAALGAPPDQQAVLGVDTTVETQAS